MWFLSGLEVLSVLGDNKRSGNELIIICPKLYANFWIKCVVSYRLHRNVKHCANKIGIAFFRPFDTNRIPGTVNLGITQGTWGCVRAYDSMAGMGYMFCNFWVSVLISIVNYLLFYKFFMLFACFSVQRDIIVVEICYKNILFASVISRSCSAVPACLLATVLNFNCMEASLSVYVSHWPLLALCLGAGKPTFRFDLHCCFILQRCLPFQLMS